MAAPNQIPTFKVVLIGPARSGKTSLVNLLQTGRFTRGYEPTIGVAVHPVSFMTNHGEIRFDVWDCAGNPEFAGLGVGNYMGADAAIVLYSLTDDDYYQTVSQFHSSFRRIRPNVQTVIVGNKSDLALPEHHGIPDVQYYEISVYRRQHLELPFLYLARHLTNHLDLEFIARPPIAPPVVRFDQRAGAL